MKLLLLLFFSAITQISKAQENVVGTWKGTSLCQVKNSPCHDEIVVYHITKGKTDLAYDIQANKIVNGAEEDMGIVHCKWDAEKNALLSTDYNSKWTFTLDGNKIHGRLITREQLYRLIEISKEQ